jgi:hypothetical protein
MPLSQCRPSYRVTRSKAPPTTPSKTQCNSPPAFRGIRSHRFRVDAWRVVALRKFARMSEAELAIEKMMKSSASQAMVRARATVILNATQILGRNELASKPP